MINKKIQRERFKYKALLSQWGWFSAFCFICLFVYHQSLMQTQSECMALREKLTLLNDQYHLAVQYRDELELKIESQDDPAWIEMMMKKALGVVPEGQIKVHFQD